MEITSRLKKAFFTLLGREDDYSIVVGPASSVHPGRNVVSYGNRKSIIGPIMNHIAVRVMNMTFKHIRVGENERYEEDLNTGLNEALTRSANIDQTGKSFIQDAVISLLDEGCIAIVPVVTSGNIDDSDNWDVYDLRVAKIIQWYPQHVKVDIYNDQVGRHVQMIFKKTKIAIVENPLYLVMNEPNSTLSRLISRLNTLDVLAAGMTSGKLDLIIQLPYLVKTQTQKDRAEARRSDLESQLASSKYGIAYSDATEKIIQLNRPVTNMLLEEVIFLSNLFYAQIGITEDVFKGTASEEVMGNYYSTTIGPIANALTDSMQRVFLTRTGFTQGQRLRAFRNVFENLPVTKLAEVTDKFSQNASISSNETRSIIGFKPDDDPESDKLRNKNVNPVDEKKEQKKDDQSKEEA